ncbi:hypothetical protein ABZ860_40800 [Microbispora sp. NPDC046973]|uniref:hypothetical protein n=1 Tax=Microbispora sp. NPDC046973 TaxID=3155022 RepID=UPI0034033974
MRLEFIDYERHSARWPVPAISESLIQDHFRCRERTRVILWACNGRDNRKWTQSRFGERAAVTGRPVTDAGPA